MDNDLFRDRHMERPGLAWFVSVNKQIICDGLKTRQQAHDFINTEIRPLMEKEESRSAIDIMNEFNTILCIVDDYDGKQSIGIGLHRPDTGLPDYDGF